MEMSRLVRLHASTEKRPFGFGDLGFETLLGWSSSHQDERLRVITLSPITSPNDGRGSIPFGGVLFNIGGFSLLGSVGVMFMLDRFLFRDRVFELLATPLLLRLPGGTGGIWLVMIKIPRLEDN